MLLLIYVLIITYFVFFSLMYDFITSVKWEVDAYYLTKSSKDYQLLVRSMTVQLSFVITTMIAILITFFLKFHIQLVSQNKTTIENLEKKGNMYKSAYDVGAHINWQ